MTAAAKQQQPRGITGLVILALGAVVVLLTPTLPDAPTMPTSTTQQEVSSSNLGDFTVMLSDSTTIAHGVEVELGSHAWAKHGIEDVGTVRAAMKAQADQFPEWFDRPPCKDGRWRYTLRLADGAWAIWVLSGNPSSIIRTEVTAFKVYGNKGQEYVNRVRDDCGIDGWNGHSFAGGADAQKGEREARTTTSAG